MTDSNEVLENLEKQDANKTSEENKNVNVNLLENQLDEKDIPEDPPPEKTFVNVENDNKELSQDAIKTQKIEDSKEENFKASDNPIIEKGSTAKNIGLVSEVDALKIAEDNVVDKLVKEDKTLVVHDISNEKRVEPEQKEKICKEETKYVQDGFKSDTFKGEKESTAKKNHLEVKDVTTEKPGEIIERFGDKTELQEKKQGKCIENKLEGFSETPQTNKKDDNKKTVEDTGKNLLNIMKTLENELKKDSIPKKIEKRELIIKVEKTNLGNWKATSGIKGKYDKVNKTNEAKVDKFVEKRETLSHLSDTKTDMELCEDKEDPVTKKITNLPDGYTDSSQSSNSEMQSPSASFETSQENNFKRINFENAIQSEPMWVDTNGSEISERQSTAVATLETTEKRETLTDVPLITIDDNTQPSSLEPQSHPTAQNQLTSFVSPGFPQPSGTAEQPIVIDSQTEGSTDGSVSQPPATASEVVPVVPPTPRKRGRPRKQVLPTPNSEAFECTFETNTPGKEPLKRSERAEKRQVKRKKFDDEKVKKRERKKQDGDEDTPKRRYTLKNPAKKKKKYTYIPKKKLPPDFSALENIQNFEEETRMSASEGPANFSSKLGMTGEESQGSSVTPEGHTKSSFSKKGRMEIMTDGCKPVTVQQIVEYCWPPPSQLPHGEKPDGLMIQEQISEYLGVKSFKRKYPTIKRRQVDMEERTYLQENGFVSENMCDMGLTAVLSSDILEIMYNDFPHKFEEYRKYVRDKKAKEQRALRERQAAERADMDPQREAVESAFSWNSEFNKLRKEKRASCIDLQTFTVHFPASRYKKISLGKPGHYPVALIPGQNTDYYKKYTSNELKYFPLNTVLYGPVRPNVRRAPVPAGSDGSQSDIDDSSSSDESSSSSSEETQDTEGTSSTVEEDNVDAKSEKHNQDVKETPKSGKNPPKATPKGRAKAKIQTPAETIPPTPKKRLGRPPKPKPAPKPPEEETPAPVKKEKTDSALGGIIYTCKMCREEETKNKNGEFESFIQCTQCHGKIHPSCIDLTAEIIPKISTYGWQCTDCKSCIKCGQSSNEDKMIFCDQCDRGYHIFCVGLNEVPSGSYVCLVCKPNTSSEATEEVKTEPSASEGGDVEMVEVKEETPEVKTENENTEKNES